MGIQLEHTHKHTRARTHSPIFPRPHREAEAAVDCEVVSCGAQPRERVHPQHAVWAGRDARARQVGQTLCIHHDCSNKDTGTRLKVLYTV